LSQDVRQRLVARNVRQYTNYTTSQICPLTELIKEKKRKPSHSASDTTDNNDKVIRNCRTDRAYNHKEQKHRQSIRFYREMHYSAKRGIAIACRPSVCPSVCDVGRSGRHRLEILENNCTDN